MMQSRIGGEVLQSWLSLAPLQGVEVLGTFGIYFTWWMSIGLSLKLTKRWIHGWCLGWWSFRRDAFWMWMFMVMNVKGLFPDQCVDHTKVYCLDWKATKNSCRKLWSSRLPGFLTSVVCIVVLRFLDLWFTHHLVNMHTHRAHMQSTLGFITSGSNPNPWTRLPGFSITMVLTDWLHLVDLAITPEASASVSQICLRKNIFPVDLMFSTKIHLNSFCVIQICFLQGSAAHILGIGRVVPNWHHLDGRLTRWTPSVWLLLISRRNVKDIGWVACLHLCSNDWTWTQSKFDIVVGMLWWGNRGQMYSLCLVCNSNVAERDVADVAERSCWCSRETTLSTGEEQLPDAGAEAFQWSCASADRGTIGGDCQCLHLHIFNCFCMIPLLWIKGISCPRKVAERGNPCSGRGKSFRWARSVIWLWFHCFVWSLS